MFRKERVIDISDLIAEKMKRNYFMLRDMYHKLLVVSLVDVGAHNVILEEAHYHGLFKQYMVDREANNLQALFYTIVHELIRYYEEHNMKVEAINDLVMSFELFTNEVSAVVGQLKTDKRTFILSLDICELNKIKMIYKSLPIK